MEHNTISHRYAALLAVTACILWSTAFVAVKYGLTFIKPFSFAGIRFMISGCMLIPFWIRHVKKSDFSLRSLSILFKVALFQTFALYGLFYFAMTLVKGAAASIIIGASPIISALIAHFSLINDKLNRSKIICMFTAAGGIVLIVVSSKPWSMDGAVEVVGIFLLMMGSVVSTIGNIIVSKDKKNIHPIFLTSVQIFLGGCMLFALSIPLEGIPDLTAQPIRFYFSLGWLSFISAAAFSIWFFLLQHDNIKVSELNLWKFIIPVFGATLSWFFLPAESPTITTVAGMALVAFAVLKFNR